MTGALAALDLSDPLRIMVLAGHVAADDREQRQEAASHLALLWGIQHSPEAAQKAIRERMRALDLLTSEPSVEQDPVGIWLANDPYWLMAEQPRKDPDA